MNLNERFWEIDFLRGLAVIMMISYHLLFDLSFFGVYPINTSSGFFWYFARITAFMFIFLVGISLHLSYSRAKMSGRYVGEKDLFFKYLKRGLKIFSLGILITLATWIFIRQDFIIFGILHFVGLAIILEYPFMKYKYFNLALGLVLIVLGFYLSNFT
ncbi:MAG TPA: heparan-alpha-glucosaminide N-acetyltransferase, partial [Methanobacterium sp.]